MNVSSNITSNIALTYLDVKKSFNEISKFPGCIGACEN